jgi:RNA polymerase primary sigma factor
VFEKINKLVKLDNKYDALGYSFTERVDLLSEDMSIPTEKVLELFAIKYQYLSISSLDVPVGESEETPLLEFIGDSSIDESDYEASMIEFRKLLEGYLETLTEREQLVLRLRYGFDDGTPRTLEVVGKRLGVTRERVRQIESKALRKLSFKMKPEDFIGFFE